MPKVKNDSPHKVVEPSVKKIRRPQLSTSQTILCMVCIVLLGFITYQVWFDHYINQANAELGTGQLRQYLEGALNNLGHTAVLDGPTTQVYLPEARLVLPAYPTSIAWVRYLYQPAQGNNFPLQISLTDSLAYETALNSLSNVSSTPALFKGVPKAEACDQQFELTFGTVSPADSSYKKEFSKTLQDNRTINIYLNSGCNNNSKIVLRYLEQVQSY